ncbi:MAG: polyphosphate polymerase domain-containing protein [Sedimentisphaerales bacterium]|nr:polyphosphate polymerase domain-containing protein [Sedimentisphaerales bacterium]
MTEDLITNDRSKKTTAYTPVRHLPKHRKPSHPLSAPAKTTIIPPMPPSPSVVNRYELKYFISESQAAAIKELIKPHIKLDKYCEIQPGGAYPLASVYLDSHDLRLCRESIEGHKNRFKLRIRRYSDDPSSPSFFEIKRRMDRVIIKNRVRVENHNVEEMLSRPFLLYKNVNGDGEMLRQFHLYMSSIGARPVVQIRYIREAYESVLDNRIRITFDRKLAFKIDNYGKLSLNGNGWNHYLTGCVILEIKFTEFFPPWLTHIVKCLELHQQSISKYARSVQHACALRFCAPTAPRRTSL